MELKNIVVLFGGQSSEHEVSCVSATTVLNQINRNKYKIFPVGITKQGKWLLYDGDVDKIAEGKWEKEGTAAILSPDATQKSLLIFQQNQVKSIPIHIVFPVLHGLYGEDGSIQGLLELSQIPYVGCGILSSSVSMDKAYTKIIAESIGIRQAEYMVIHRQQLWNEEEIVQQIEERFGYPVFVKPSNAGSSVGITKAHNRSELRDGLNEAIQHDRKILIEENIAGREVECAVLGNDKPKASGVGEIIAGAEFYDYNAKYKSNVSRTVVDADLPKEIREKVRKVAVEIFKAVDGTGLARVDFFIQDDEVIFNEINTLPGFTSISMYPMLWENQGISKKELVDKLIQLAQQRKDKN